MTRLTYLVTLLTLSIFTTSTIESKKNWDKINWDQVEKDLQEGDDPELLESEDSITAMEYEKRKKMPLQPPSDAALK